MCQLLAALTYLPAADIVSGFTCIKAIYRETPELEEFIKLVAIN